MSFFKKALKCDASCRGVGTSGPVEQARNDRLGSVGGSRAVTRARLPAAWAERAVHGTPATRHCTYHLRDRLAQRAGMRTPCALGGMCAPVAPSFGRQRTAVAAICSDGRFVAGAAQIRVNADRSPGRRPPPPGGRPAGRDGEPPSDSTSVFWSRGHVGARSGRWSRG
jgi:hypothetical protein